MKYFQLFTLFIFMSCGNEKIVQLPEITHSEVSEILDVSAAYLFYDETKEDSIELNRRTLISTTNWLINVDKRLTLKQVIPKITFLQDKKRNAELHKNEAAKNYYTCNNTSIKSLGFIEFTDVFYKEKQPTIKNIKQHSLFLIYHSVSDIILKPHGLDSLKTSEDLLLKDIQKIVSKLHEPATLYLYFNKDLTFQSYITCKSLLYQLKSDKLKIAKDEFLFN